MKHHWSLKLIALVLACLFAGLMAVSGLSVAANWNYGSYESGASLEKKQEELLEGTLGSYAWEAAMTAAVKYVKESNTSPGTVQREIWEEHFNYTWHSRGIWPEFEYSILDGADVVASNKDLGEHYVRTVETTVYVEDGAIVDLGSARKAFPFYEDLPMEYQWISYSGVPLPDIDSRTVYYELLERGDYGRVYRMERFEDIPVDVQIHLTQNDLNQLTYNVGGLSLMEAAWNLREYDIAAAAVSAVGLLLTALYLCFAAGKTPDGQVLPRGTNRWPLDLFFGLACLPGVLWGAGGVYFIERTGWSSDIGGVYWFMAGLAACAAGLALCVVLWLMALSAQIRQGGGAWYRQSILGRCGLKVWRLCRKIFVTLLGIDLMKKCWVWARESFKSLHLCWQWSLGLAVLLALATATAVAGEGWSLVIVLMAGIPMVLYGAYGFSRLRDAANRMAQGDLETKIATLEEHLYGNFADFAEDLNDLGETCVEAALARMKSERMKTELITNVSHDIKTPLTSIINYVDLLKKAETEEARREYLEVLERQSQRLKKLIEDLMEMSRASSGNMAVELSGGDLIEAVNQALGEFADRMAQQDLEVIFRQRDQSVEATFDGKLLWRVMSNVLSNVVKYALPGTRVYVDVLADDSRVYLSVKNISRDPLNITAEELMERFVRGDESRNSEGNGLGLNIARSLMEAQGGGLTLTVDGDLFKVTLSLS